MFLRRKSAKISLLAAFAALVFMVSGCDALYEFWGMNGGTDDGGKAENPEQPPDPPPLPTPTEATPLASSDGEEPVLLYVDEDDPSQGFYEIHAFIASEEQNEFTLAFPPGTASVENADYFIVAGGGGAGGSDSARNVDYGGGGGAGGLLYKTGQTLPLVNGSVTVTVGRGGAGGQIRLPGGDGGYSVIGDIAVPGGGGGGGSYTTAEAAHGKPGGSGGGSAADYGMSGPGPGQGPSHTTGSAYSGEPLDAEIKGHSGGAAGPALGGGGGGAESAGGSNAGGDPWTPAENSGWEWLKNVTGGTEEFSRGGSSNSGVSGGKPGEYYGDGGSGGNGVGQPGGSGHDGIVVIRFFRRQFKSEAQIYAPKRLR